MKYEDMSDRQIEFKVWINGDDKGSKRTYKNNGKVLISRDEHGNQRYEDVPKYCSNPSDSWPIIVENAISITSVGDLTWNADSLVSIEESADNYNHFECVSACSCQHKNPLRAAMICFIKMKDAEK